MAKITKKYSFSKGVLSKDENGNFIMTEINKDDEVSYSLTEVLDTLTDTKGFSISFGIDDSIE